MSARDRVEQRLRGKLDQTNKKLSKKQEEEDDDYNYQPDQDRVSDDSDEDVKPLKSSKRQDYDEEDESDDAPVARKQTSSKPSRKQPEDEIEEEKPKSKSRSSKSSRTSDFDDEKPSRKQPEYKDEPDPEAQQIKPKRTSGRRSASKMEFKPATSADYEVIPKQAIMKLLRSNSTNGPSGECVEVGKDILARIVKQALSLSSGSITGDKVTDIMNAWVREDQLLDDILIPSSNFIKFIAPIEAELGVKCKRDAYYILQIYTETLFTKLITGANKIASSNRRQRIVGVDLITAFEIKMF